MIVSSFGETQANVAKLLAGTLGREIQAPEYSINLVDLSGVRYDSATAFECVATLEEHFAIEVDFVMEDLNFHLKSIENISKFVNAKINDKSINDQ